ncbi:ATP-binding cassette domain-containing protein [Microbacterium gilvum]|uniref:ABC transporter ATP-binding protein n=1 Tax=Microbacterium gilvum TaxID=1336204 RepID=A0ABP8ZNN2_9MICO
MPFSVRRSAIADLTPAGWTIVALAAVRALALAAAALATGAAVDDVRAGGDPAAALAVAAVAVLAAALLAAIEAILPPREAAREERVWRARVVRAQLAAPLDDDTPAGDRVARATEEVERFANYRAAFLGPFAAGIVVPVVVIVVIGAFASWGIAAPLAVCAALIPPVIAWFMARFRAGSGRFRMVSGRLSAAFLETVRALGTIRLLGADEQRRRGLARQAEALRAEAMRLLRRNQVVLLVTDAVFGVVMLSLVGVLAVAGTADGALTAGAAFSLLLLTVPLREPVDRLGRSFYVGLAGRAAGERVRAAAASDALEAAPATAGASVAATGVHVRRGGRDVVVGADLDLSDGMAVVTGPSGSGKSSLGLALAGLIPADGFLVDGAPADEAALRGVVGYVPQRSVLFTGTVRDNLLLAAPGASDEQLTAALSRAGVDRSELPDGLGTRVGEGAAGVSGGQAQRIAIARALLSDRRVIVADEPTAQLDAGTAARVAATLREIARDRCVVLITHRLDEVRAADRITVVEGGTTTFSGTPADIDASPFLRAAFAAGTVEGTRV